jgi:hypothetical protein
MLDANGPEKDDPRYTPVPNNADAQTGGDIYTYSKHGMDYFTEEGVVLRTGYINKKEWYLVTIRELLDNAADFLTQNYKGVKDTVIDTTIFKDDKAFKLKIRNSNYKNIPVFSNLQAIFDYEMRYGSKQDVHVISRGMLGDALKQIRAFEYVLLHVGYGDTAGTFQDKQAKYPIVIQHNGIKSSVYLTVDSPLLGFFMRVLILEVACMN